MDEIPKKIKGDVIDDDDLKSRIYRAVDDMLDDANDAAILHNLVCQGKVELIDPDEEEDNPDEEDEDDNPDFLREYLFVMGEDEETLTMENDPNGDLIIRIKGSKETSVEINNG